VGLVRSRARGKVLGEQKDPRFGAKEARVQPQKRSYVRCKGEIVEITREGFDWNLHQGGEGGGGKLGEERQHLGFSDEMIFFFQHPEMGIRHLKIWDGERRNLSYSRSRRLGRGNPDSEVSDRASTGERIDFVKCPGTTLMR